MTRTGIALLVALLVAALGLAAPAAAAPTCDGKTATIVGSPGASLRGTERADVIVSNGSDHVSGLGGSDRICMTGTPLDDYIYVNGGYGHDHVFIRTAVRRHVFAYLGPGNDLYIGGSGSDYVDAGAASTRDRIGTGAGVDHVTVGASATGTADIVRLGTGSDHLEVMGRPAKDAVFEGDSGVDSLTVSRSGSFPEARLNLDNGDEVARVNGQVAFRWDSFQHFTLWGHDPGVYFSGSARPEIIRSFHLVGAAMGGGDDVMDLGVLAVPGLLRGGGGRDLIDTGGYPWVTGNVAAGRIDWEGGDERPEVAFADVEDLNLVGDTVRLLGDNGPNRLDGFGCGVEIFGYGGNDTLLTTWEEDLTDECPSEVATMSGGDGDDRMTGGRGNDKLYGGRGNDSADGRRGTDLCRAEQRANCELE